MNAQERKVIDRIDGVIKTIGTLTPRNPMDIKAIAHNLPLATGAAQRLTTAIGYLRIGDWESVDVELTGAERIVELQDGQR